MKNVETALVIDSDFLMRGFIMESLKKENIIATEVRTFDEAKPLLESRWFDLVFCDLDHIRMDALDRGTEAACPLLIITTSFAKVEQAIGIVRDNAYDCLIKPFSPEQVSVLIARARELARLRGRITELETRTTSSGEKKPDNTVSTPSTTNLQELERETILRVMNETDGSRNKTADRLGISVRTLRNKLNQYRKQQLMP